MIWLLGCLVAWLIGFMVDWLHGCLVSWLPGCMVAWLLFSTLLVHFLGCLFSLTLDSVIDANVEKVNDETKSLIISLFYEA